MGLGCNVDFNVMASVAQDHGYCEDLQTRYTEEEPVTVNESASPKDENAADWATIHKLYTPQQVMRAMAILATISSMMEEEEVK